MRYAYHPIDDAPLKENLNLRVDFSFQCNLCSSPGEFSPASGQRRLQLSYFHIGVLDGQACATVQRGEQRVQLPPEGSGEGVDVGLGVRVVEGHLALLVVQVDPQTSRHEAGGQCRLRLGAGVEMVRAAPQDPVAVPRAHGEPAVPLGAGRGHSHAPVAVFGDVHLPVVAAAAVALPAQHAGPAVESLQAGRHVGLREALLDPPLVLGQLQPGVVGHGVQNHVRWTGKRERPE